MESQLRLTAASERKLCACVQSGSGDRVGVQWPVRVKGCGSNIYTTGSSNRYVYGEDW